MTMHTRCENVKVGCRVVERFYHSVVSVGLVSERESQVSSQPVEAAAAAPPPAGACLRHRSFELAAASLLSSPGAVGLSPSRRRRRRRPRPASRDQPRLPVRLS